MIILNLAAPASPPWKSSSPASKGRPFLRAHWRSEISPDPKSQERFRRTCCFWQFARGSPGRLGQVKSCRRKCFAAAWALCYCPAEASLQNVRTRPSSAPATSEVFETGARAARRAVSKLFRQPSAILGKPSQKSQLVVVPLLQLYIS